MSRPVSAPEIRRRAIEELVHAEGAVRVDELAERFDVSPMTVHRDLEALAATGRVERVRGGARSAVGTLAERDVAQRRSTNVAVKQALAEVALELIEPGSVVALDDSTTVEALGARLHECSPTAVITHSLSLMVELGHRAPQIPLIGLGGRYEPGTDSFLGTATARQTEDLSADVAVVSTTSVRGGGLYHPDEDAALTKTACVRLGRSRILVVDSSKFGAAGLYFVAGLDEFQHIVVDDAVDGRAAEMLQASGAQVHRVAVPGTRPHTG